MPTASDGKADAMNGAIAEWIADAVRSSRCEYDRSLPGKALSKATGSGGAVFYLLKINQYQKNCGTN